MNRISRGTIWTGVVAGAALFAVILLLAQSEAQEKPREVRETTAPEPRVYRRAGGNVLPSPGRNRFAMEPKEQAAEGERTTKIRTLRDAFAKSENEADRKKITDELAALVAEQFDLRQKWRDRELKELEAELARLRGIHDKRGKQKDLIVQEHTRQLLREAEGLGWGDENGPVNATGAGDPLPELRDH
jgi:hypothetical protein